MIVVDLLDGGYFEQHSAAERMDRGRAALGTGIYHYHESHYMFILCVNSLRVFESRMMRCVMFGDC